MLGPSSASRWDLRSIPKLLLDVVVLFRAVRLLPEKSYDLLNTHEEAGFFVVLLARLFKPRHLYDMLSSPSQQLSDFQHMGFGPPIRLFEWIEAEVVNSGDAVIMTGVNCERPTCSEPNSFRGMRRV